MGMRVIAGSARGQKLKMVPGETTRPITDRVKENLFNILGDWVIGTYWLDLFAGTGQVGIEALSRGAAGVIFIDNAKAAVRTTEQNLQHTKLDRNAQVFLQDAFSYLNKKSTGIFDVIYIAPPQYQKIWILVLDVLDQDPSKFLTSTGMIIVQIDPKEYASGLYNNLNLFDQRRYGNTKLCFYEVAG